MSTRSKIFFLDDHPDYAETAIEMLIEAGHSVPLVAHFRKEAEKLISLFDEYHVNVAILDRRLDPTDEKNADGERIGKLIQETHPEVIIIGNSNDGIKCATLNNLGEEITPLVEMVTNA